MKNKELIALLKKLPKDLPVYWADHDQSEYEVNNSVHRVQIVEKPDVEDNPEELEKWNKQRNGMYERLEEKYILLRP